MAEVPVPPTITVTIENKHPVELIDFTKSLLALGDQFKRDVEARDEHFEGKLYVQELRKGSLVAVLQVLAANGPAALEAANTVYEFVGNLRSTLGWLRGDGRQPDRPDTRRVGNVSTVLEPVAKDEGSNITIVVNGDANAPITINSEQANAVQNRAQRYLAEQKAPESATHKKVLMYWAQVRNQDGPPISGEKAMIDKLSDRPVKVVFDNRELRDEMLYSSTNPLQEAYIVDVEVQTVRGRIASYKILQLHERIRLDEDDEPASRN